MTRTGKTGRGFTIVEVIVIVVIIGVIAAVIAPQLLSRIGQSKQALAASNAASLASQMQLFLMDHGKPESGATINVLYERPSNVPEASWKPYVSSPKALVDPWGRPFVLVIPGNTNIDFDIVSYGADGRPGGTDEDADIVKP
jgi:general secretion pathway protein G